MHGHLGIDSECNSALILFDFRVADAFTCGFSSLSKELFFLQVSRVLSAKRV